MAITNQPREEMSATDYCDALSKEGYSPAAIRKRLLVTAQPGSRQSSVATRQKLEEAFDDRLRSLKSPG